LADSVRCKLANKPIGKKKKKKEKRKKRKKRVIFGRALEVN